MVFDTWDPPIVTVATGLAAKPATPAVKSGTYTSREFQQALRREPLPFCRGCHAPEADSRRPQPALAAIGIACITCHVPAGSAVLSARPAEAPQTALHPVLR